MVATRFTKTPILLACEMNLHFAQSLPLSMPEVPVLV